jgi:hypothetical protein
MRRWKQPTFKTFTFSASDIFGSKAIQVRRVWARIFCPSCARHSGRSNHFLTASLFSQRPREACVNGEENYSASFARNAFCSRSDLLIAVIKSRVFRHRPPLSAFLATLALPTKLVGPVDWFQGFHSRILQAWSCRCSTVHFRAAIKTSL